MAFLDHRGCDTILALTRSLSCQLRGPRPSPDRSKWIDLILPDWGSTARCNGIAPVYTLIPNDGWTSSSSGHWSHPISGFHSLWISFVNLHFSVAPPFPLIPKPAPRPRIAPFPNFAKIRNPTLRD